MADTFFKLEWDTSGIERLLGAAPEAVERVVLRESEPTAHRIATEAQRRVRVATGETREGIGVEPLDKGVGFAVVSRNRRMPNLPLWLDEGTAHRDDFPFFDVSVRLEEGPYLRRIEDGIADEWRGLGQ